MVLKELSLQLLKVQQYNNYFFGHIAVVSTIIQRGVASRQAGRGVQVGWFEVSVGVLDIIIEGMMVGVADEGIFSFVAKKNKKITPTIPTKSE